MKRRSFLAGLAALPFMPGDALAAVKPGNGYATGGFVPPGKYQHLIATLAHESCHDLQSDSLKVLLHRVGSITTGPNGNEYLEIPANE